MIAIQIIKVKSIQKQFEDKIIKQRLNAIEKLEKIAPDSTDDCNYLYKVKELFKNNIDIITWTPERTKIEIKNFPPIPLIIKKENDKVIKSPIKDKIIDALGYDNLRQSFYPIYFRELKIKSCVYCNSQLTITAAKQKKNKLSAKFDVDHYKSKDEFPFLSICLFNLYPSCPSCNRAKSKNDNIEFELYTNEISKTIHSDYKFRLTKESKAKYFVTKDNRFLEFTFEEPQYSLDKKEFKEVFHIHGIYETQKDIIEDLIIKSQIYNPSYVRLLKNSFNNIGVNSDLFKRSLVGAYTEDKDIHKRPMNKFIMDIAKELGLIE
jgi:hypothetical protein